MICLAILTYVVSQDVAPRGSPKGTTQQMADTSTWVHGDGGWRCVMHTETPLEANAAHKPS